MEIDYPTGAQEPQLRTLWQLSFGDSEEFIAGFFASGYCPRRCRCAAENGNVAAALYWFDAEFRGQKFAYLYAVATHPDFRNRGLCHGLWNYLLRFLMENQRAAASTAEVIRTRVVMATSKVSPVAGVTVCLSPQSLHLPSEP